MAKFRLILALAAQYGWDVDHMDVVTAFLNPKIDRDNIYMEMPLGIDWLVSDATYRTEAPRTEAHRKDARRMSEACRMEVV